MVGATKAIDFDIEPFVSPGFREVVLENGTTVIAGTIGMPGKTNISEFASFSYSNSTEFRFAIITNKADTDVPYRFLESFLRNNLSSIISALYYFSAFLMVAFAVTTSMVGSNIVAFLQKLRETL